MQPFCGSTSTETRLVPNPSYEIIDYDCKEYEQKLFYFNREIRT